MNIVDVLILVVIAASAVFGLYKGFINSVFSLLALFASLLLAYSAYPRLADTLKGNDGLVNTLVQYSDTGSFIQDKELAQTSVSNLPQQVLDEVLQGANLPKPFDSFVRDNVANQVFSSTGIDKSISDYLNQTIIDSSINILCFLICFVVAYLVLTILIHLISYVFSLPVLKHFDMLLGGVFGAVRGVFLVFVIFALVPIIITISPVDGVSELIDSAKYASIFYQNNFVMSIFQGFIS